MKAGWVAKTVGDCCEVISGQSPEGKFYNSKGKGLPFYQGKKEFGEKFIQPASTWTEQITKVAEQGDILMSVRAPVGPINFANETICIGRGLAAIRCSEQLDRDYLFYQFLQLQPEIAGREGAVFASINKTEISELFIAVAPMLEQKRIVAVLDAAFAEIATAKANAEKNLQNARALFESYLNKVFAERGDGWIERKVSEIAKHSLGKMLDKAKNKGNQQPYLRNLNVRWFEFDLSDLQQMLFQPEEEAKYTAIKGDVLICEGGYPGRAAIWNENYAIHFQKALHRVRFTEPLHNRWFLYYLYIQDQTGALKRHFTGTGIQHFTGEALARFVIPLPPQTDMSALLVEFDVLKKETQRLESLYEQKLAVLDELKQSLLHQAFSGQL